MHERYPANAKGDCPQHGLTIRILVHLSKRPQWGDSGGIGSATPAKRLMPTPNGMIREASPIPDQLQPRL